ncbi:MAG: MFS transporter [Chloroflexi bacterium]|nr:MFS transporter [Chloroflexota bacterium]
MEHTATASMVTAISARQRLTLLLVAVTGHAVKHLFNAAFFVLLPEIKAELALSNVQVGTLSTLRNIAGGVANLPAGFLADRFGRSRPLILGASIVLVGLFGLLLGLASGYWSAVIASTLLVVAITFWHPSAISALSQRFAERRGFAIGLHGTGGSIGEALGPLVAGALLALLTWRGVLQVGFVPAVAAGVVIWLLLRRVPMEAEGVSGVSHYLQSLRKLIGNRSLVIVLLLAGGFVGGQSVVMTFLPIYLREDLGLSSVALGFYLFLAQAAGIGSQPVLGLLSDRVGRKAVLVPSFLFLGLAFLGVSVAPPGWPFVVAVVAMGAFLFSLMSIILAASVDLVDRSVQATVVSLVFGASIVVAGISPAVAGVLADSYGTKAAFMLASGMLVATAVFAGVTRWRRAD